MRTARAAGAVAAVAAAVTTAMDPEVIAREKAERRAPTWEEKEPARTRDPWIFLPEEKVSE